MSKKIAKPLTKSQKVISAIFLGLIILVSLGSGAISYYFYAANRDLVEIGRDGEATVTGKKTTRRRSKNRSIAFNTANARLYYTVKYRFRAGTKVYSETAHVSKEFYSSVNNGDNIPVRYLPGNPSVNEIEPGELGTNFYASAGISLGFGFIAALILFFVRRENNKRRQRSFGRDAKEV